MVKDGVIILRNYEYINGFYVCVGWDYWVLIKNMFKNWVRWCFIIWNLRKEEDLIKEIKRDMEEI